MKITVRNLLQGPVELSVNCAPEDIDLEAQDYVFTGQVTGDMVFQMVEHKVLARGIAQATAETECVRCLRRFTIPLIAHLEVLYDHDPELLKDDADAFNVDDEYVTWFDGETIQPAPEIREALLVELPDLPVCSEQCKGLCQRCGADLNMAPCACPVEQKTAKETGETEWKNALRKIRLK